MPRSAATSVMAMTACPRSSCARWNGLSADGPMTTMVAADVATCPAPGQVNELRAVGDQDEVPRLPVLRGRGPAPRLEDPVQVGRGNRVAGEGPDVAPRGNCLPSLHTSMISQALAGRDSAAAARSPGQLVLSAYTGSRPG